MPIDQQVAVRAVLILADPSLAERPIGEVGEASAHEGPDVGERRFGRRPIADFGIDRRPVRVMGDLEAARFEIGKAIIDVAAVEIRPARQMARLETRISRIRREKEHFLAGRKDPRRQQVREQPAEPRPAGEDEFIGDDPIAAAGGQRLEPAPGAGRRDRGLEIGSPGADELRHHRLDGASCHQCPEARFEEALIFHADRHRRNPASKRVAAEQSGRQAERAMNPQRILQEGIGAGKDEKNADLVEQGKLGALRKGAPFGQRVERHSGVDFIGSIRAAGHSRFSAGRGSGMGRPPGVDQQDPLPRLEQIPGGPGAEHAGTHHRDVPARRCSGPRLARSSRRNRCCGTPDEHRAAVRKTQRPDRGIRSRSASGQLRRSPAAGRR